MARYPRVLHRPPPEGGRRETFTVTSANSSNSVELTFEAKAAMLLARIYRTLEFEELKPFPRNGLIIFAVRIVETLVLIWINKLACQHSQNLQNRSLHTCKQQNTRAQQLLNMSRNAKCSLPRWWFPEMGIFFLSCLREKIPERSGNFSICLCDWTANRSR